MYVIYSNEHSSRRTSPNGQRAIRTKCSPKPQEYNLFACISALVVCFNYSIGNDFGSKQKRSQWQCWWCSESQQEGTDQQYKAIIMMMIIMMMMTRMVVVVVVVVVLTGHHSPQCTHRNCLRPHGCPTMSCPTDRISHSLQTLWLGFYSTPLPPRQFSSSFDLTLTSQSIVGYIAILTIWFPKYLISTNLTNP